MAASLARLARSAPEKPGVPRAMASRLTSGASFLSRQCTARIAARSVTFGSGIVTCRSNRPGRSRAGSRISGRFVAASTTMPAEGSNPSISASSWFSVCSRSSLDTTAPEPARRWPIASISSMKMMAGARLRACSNRSRTRDAPTPTNSSTKPDPVTEKNGTSASPATARASSVLPVPGGPTMSTPRGTIAPTRVYRSGIWRKSTTSADLGLGALVAGHVGERGFGPFLVEHLGPGPAHAERALQAAARAAGDAAEQPDEDQDRQPEGDQVDQHLGAEAVPRRGRGDLHVVVLQLGQQLLARLRRDDHGEASSRWSACRCSCRPVCWRAEPSSPGAPTRRRGTGSRSGWSRASGWAGGTTARR